MSNTWKGWVKYAHTGLQTATANIRGTLMNKSELIEIMASSADISKNAAERALGAFVDSITNSLSNGNDVILVGFGSFTTSHRAARIGRNPQTGQTMQIPAATVAKFKAGKKLKEAVNKS